MLTAIVEDNGSAVEELLKTEPALATRLIRKARRYDSKVFHWIYIGDTALHLAAAGYRVDIVRLLLAAGAIRLALRHPIGVEAVGGGPAHRAAGLLASFAGVRKVRSVGPQADYECSRACQQFGSPTRGSGA